MRSWATPSTAFSEVMLQHTEVATVMNKNSYTEWIGKRPTVEHSAASTLEDV